MPATTSAMPPRALSRLVCAAMTAMRSRAARSARRADGSSSVSRSSGEKISGWWLDDHAAPQTVRLVQRGVVHLQGDKHAREPVGVGARLHAQLVVRAADLQADVVPRLGQLERSQLVHRGDDLSHVHEPILPERVHSPHDHRCRRRPAPTRSWLVLVAVLPGIFLTLADATVMSVAVPQIIRSMTASVIAVSWVMNGYNLVLTVLFLTMGRLADRYGHRRVFVARASRCSRWRRSAAPRRTPCRCWSRFRVVQAVGAAAVVPASLALLMQAYPAHRQGFAAGLFGALSSAAAAFGPGARRRARADVGLAGHLLVQPAGRRPGRRAGPDAHPAPPARGRRRPARLGSASASAAPACSASRWPSSRATSGAG